MMTASISNRGALGWLGAVLAGGISAAIFAFALSFAGSKLALFAYIAPIPLFMVGLGSGAVSGVLASFFGALALYLFPTTQILTVAFVTINALPAALLCLLAMRKKFGADGKVYWYPEGYLLTALAIYPCLIFVATFFIAADHDGGLLALTMKTIQAGLEQQSANTTPEVATLLSELKEPIARILPSMIGISWMSLMIFCGAAAQSTLRQQNWNLREQFNFREINVPNWLTVALAITGLAVFIAPEPYDYVGINIFVMLCMPFFLVGIAVFHFYAATKKARIPLLILFYMLFMFPPMAALMAVLVTLLGSVDQAFDFRQRITNFTKQP